MPEETNYLNTYEAGRWLGLSEKTLARYRVRARARRSTASGAGFAIGAPTWRPGQSCTGAPRPATTVLRLREWSDEAADRVDGGLGHAPLSAKVKLRCGSLMK